MSEREIFCEAIQKPTAAERRIYLDQACGNDSEMRSRIEKLLAEQSGLGSFMEYPPVKEHFTDFTDQSRKRRDLHARWAVSCHHAPSLGSFLEHRLLDGHGDKGRR
jgi:hypothetical protein